jgi:hypothetical protein
MRAAGHLIGLAHAIEWNYDPENDSHVLFAIQPRGKDLLGRKTPIADTATTDRIWEIISYAAAKAHVQRRISFYQMISKNRDFRGSAGQMFGRFVLSRLTSGPDVDPLACSPATLGSPVLNILACGKERTSFFSNKTALKKAKWDVLPVCFLPTTPQTFATVDAIIFTNELIITVQVTISDKHNAEGIGFADIKESILPHIREHRDWCHVFITDNDRNAESLRGQNLSDFPVDISVYSGVFHLGRVTLAHLQAFDETKVCVSWLHAIGAYWGIIRNALAKIGWTLTMSDSDRTRIRVRSLKPA